jgi:hypothetical protein
MANFHLGPAEDFTRSLYLASVPVSGLTAVNPTPGFNHILRLGASGATPRGGAGTPLLDCCGVLTFVGGAASVGVFRKS